MKQRDYVPAHMGNPDLIPEHYFRTPRRSGLPHNYFHNPQRTYWRVIAVVAAALLLVAACA